MTSWGRGRIYELSHPGVSKRCLTTQRLGPRSGVRWKEEGREWCLLEVEVLTKVAKNWHILAH
jgi:hypothetical protein